MKTKQPYVEIGRLEQIASFCLAFRLKFSFQMIAMHIFWFSRYGTAGNFDLYREDYILLYVDTIREIVKSEDPSRPFVVSSPSNGRASEDEGYIARNPYSELYGDSRYTLCFFMSLIKHSFHFKLLPWIFPFLKIITTIITPMPGILPLYRNLECLPSMVSSLFRLSRPGWPWQTSLMRTTGPSMANFYPTGSITRWVILKWNSKFLRDSVCRSIRPTVKNWLTWFIWLRFVGDDHLPGFAFLKRHFKDKSPFVNRCIKHRLSRWRQSIIEDIATS